MTMGCNTVEVRVEPRCLFEVYPEKKTGGLLGNLKAKHVKKKSDLPKESIFKDAKLVQVQSHGILYLILGNVRRAQTITMTLLY